MVTDADLYRKSSQYRRWSFSKADFYTKIEVPNRKVPPNDFTLSCDEERQLILFYAVEPMRALCEQFKLSSQVRATAVSYFRKFYLRFSVMEHRPKVVLPTCVFFAAKAENVYIPIGTFCESLGKTEPQAILDLEFILFRALDFTLTVHNGLRPLHGFFLDMQAVLKDIDLSELCKLHDQAKKKIIDAFVSDVCFLYTPTQIALAALMDVNELVTTQYMAHSMDGPNTGLDRLLEIVHDCKAGLDVEVPSREICKPIVKKLEQYYKQDGPPQKRQRLD